MPDARPTTASRLAQYGDAARARLAPHIAGAGVAYPPPALTLVAIKDEQRLEVWARAEGGPRWIRDYPVLAASGLAGPKLREGDGQVPEGLYRIDWLNPNSRYHLSMHLDYPNAWDRAHAEGRADLGGDIMIHGDAVSIGCLAMGDPAIEELFVLVADTGLDHIDVIVAPTDLRTHAAAVPGDAPAWTAELYEAIAAALRPYARR